MRKIILLLIVYIIAINTILSAQTPTKKENSILRFIENKNQWDKKIKYRLDLPGGYLFLKNNSLQYSFYDQKKYLELAGHAHKHHKNNQPKTKVGRTSLLKAHSFELSFKNANQNPKTLGTQKYDTKYNYFLDKDSKKWGKNAMAFAEITYQEIYNNIDLRIYEDNKSLKYEFQVAAHTSPKEIIMEYQYADSIKLIDDNLVIYTRVTTIQETKPYSYQIINGKKITIPSKFQLKGNEVSFVFPKGYDPNYPLIIDPKLVFSTYSGSISDNWGFTACYDSNGNAISGGIVFGSNFPVSVGAFNVDYNGGFFDLAILKYNTVSGSLMYATFLGGENNESPHSMITNSKDELLVLGSTSSLKFPTLATSYDNTFNGGQRIQVYNFGEIDRKYEYTNGSDFFIAKLSADGSNLLASTYIGGSGNDALNLALKADVTIKNYGDQFRGDIFVDDKDEVYVASVTKSTDFPITTGAHQNTLKGLQDAVVFKMDADLSNLIWSTYFGGSGFEGSGSIKINANNELYICGFTTSNDLPTAVSPTTLHPNAFGDDDGYIAKFDNAGNLLAVTYLGTSSADQAFLLDLDKEGNVYVTGQTLGSYPVTIGVYSNPNSKQFIHKINSTLSTSLLSTVIGSGRNLPDIMPTAFLVNTCDNIYLCGWGGDTNSEFGFIKGSSTIGLPLKSAYQSETDGSDFYLVIIEKDFKSLLYGTYFGSQSSNDHVDGGTSRFDKNGGIVYQSVCASCNTDTNGFPTTPNAFSSVDNSANCNNAVFKFVLDALIPDFDPYDKEIKNIVFQDCLPFEGNFVYKGIGAETFSWDIEGIGKFDNLKTVPFLFDKVGEYKVTLTVRNDKLCTGEKSITKKIKVFDRLTLETNSDGKICKGDAYQLQATVNGSSGGTIVYKWSPAIGLDNPNIANPKASPESTTQYVVEIDNGACTRIDSVKVDILEKPTLEADLSVSAECGKASEVYFNLVDQNYASVTWNMGDGTILNGVKPKPYIYKNPGKYNVIVTVSNGVCTNSVEKELIIEDNTGFYPNVITSDKNEYFVLPNSNRKLEIFDRWGTLVYESDDYQNDWGKEAKPATYYYLITSPNGVKCKGWVQVIK